MNNNLNYLNKLWINDNKTLKRSYQFIDLSKSSINDIKLKENINYNLVNDVENYDIYEASCLYDKLSEDDYNDILKLLSFLDENINIHLKIAEIYNYKESNQSIENINLDSFINQIDRLNNVLKENEINLKNLIEKNREIIGDLL